LTIITTFTQIVTLVLWSGEKPWIINRAICSPFAGTLPAARCQLWPETALQQAAIPKTAGTAMLMLRFRLGAKKI